MTRDCHSLVAWVSIGGLVLGCGNSQPAPVAPSTPSPEPAPAPSTPGASTPVLSNCVLHAGEAYREEHRKRAPGGQPEPAVETRSRCSFNAECVAQHGKQTPGDGFVSLSCVEDDCSCRIEPLTSPSTPVEFRFRASCSTGDQAEQLLLTHCLQGMQVEPKKPD